MKEKLRQVLPGLYSTYLTAIRTPALASANRSRASLCWLCDQLRVCVLPRSYLSAFPVKPPQSLISTLLTSNWCFQPSEFSRAKAKPSILSVYFSVQGFNLVCFVFLPETFLFLTLEVFFMSRNSKTCSPLSVGGCALESLSHPQCAQEVRAAAPAQALTT